MRENDLNIQDTIYCDEADPVDSCESYELLMGRVIDGESSPEQRQLLDEHIASCPKCRETMAELRHIAEYMRARCSVPPRPKTIARRWTTARIFRSAAKVAAIAAVCAASFFIGRYSTAGRSYDHLSPMLSVGPSLWRADRSLASSMEQPFTDSIVRYRSAIADEIVKPDVDWTKIRTLLEAMGEMRTDLELLTLHMAYLDINTGSSPREVADHWISLGGHRISEERP